jgi:hypothetical protein
MGNDRNRSTTPRVLSRATMDGKTLAAIVANSPETR